VNFTGCVQIDPPVSHSHFYFKGLSQFLNLYSLGSMCSSCSQLGFTTENDTAYWVNDTIAYWGKRLLGKCITSGWQRSFASCTEWCLQTPNCEGATYNSNTEFCYLKTSLTVSQYWKGAITGIKCSSVSDCQT
jgi:hypothetical protein